MQNLKLVHTGWVSNKVLLRSTGNYSQSPVINHNGKEKNRQNPKPQAQTDSETQGVELGNL